MNCERKRLSRIHYASEACNTQSHGEYFHRKVSCRYSAMHVYIRLVQKVSHPRGSNFQKYQLPNCLKARKVFETAEIKGEKRCNVEICVRRVAKMELIVEAKLNQHFSKSQNRQVSCKKETNRIEKKVDEKSM